MDTEYLEKELLEISAFLNLFCNLNYKEIDEFDLQIIIKAFSRKADKLYCHVADSLTKEMQKERAR